jgi:hypothetical protein
MDQRETPHRLAPGAAFVLQGGASVGGLPGAAANPVILREAKRSRWIHLGV